MEDQVRKHTYRIYISGNNLEQDIYTQQIIINQDVSAMKAFMSCMYTRTDYLP